MQSRIRPWENGIRWILDNKYDTTYKGLDGNDDGATLSGWYIFSSLGFYPIAGSDVYQIGAPLFREAEVKIGENSLLIEAENYAPENRYVQKIWLNDTVLDRSWIRHSEIANGGVLRFEMAAAPAAQCSEFTSPGKTGCLEQGPGNRHQGRSHVKSHW